MHDSSFRWILRPDLFCQAQGDDSLYNIANRLSTQYNGCRLLVVQDMSRMRAGVLLSILVYRTVISTDRQTKNGDMRILSYLRQPTGVLQVAAVTRQCNQFTFIVDTGSCFCLHSSRDLPALTSIIRSRLTLHTRCDYQQMLSVSGLSRSSRRSRTEYARSWMETHCQHMCLRIV